jgi:hypothetical protein
MFLDNCTDVHIDVDDSIVVCRDATAVVARTYRFTTEAAVRHALSYKQGQETLGFTFEGEGSVLPDGNLRIYQGRRYDPLHGFWWELDSEAIPGEPVEVVLKTKLPSVQTAQGKRFALRMHIEERAGYSLSLGVPVDTLVLEGRCTATPADVDAQLVERAIGEYGTTEKVTVSMNETGPVTVRTRVEIT